MNAATLPPPPESNIASIAASAPQIWISPPKGANICPHTGLGHAKFYRSFCGNRNIRQARMSDKSRGVRLLWLPDIYAELERRVLEQSRAEVAR